MKQGLRSWRTRLGVKALDPDQHFVDHHFSCHYHALLGMQTREHVCFIRDYNCHFFAVNHIFCAKPYPKFEDFGVITNEDFNNLYIQAGWHILLSTDLLGYLIRIMSWPTGMLSTRSLNLLLWGKIPRLSCQGVLKQTQMFMNV